MLEPDLTEPSAFDLAEKWLSMKVRSPVLEYVSLRICRSFEPFIILTALEMLTQPGLHALKKTSMTIKWQPESPHQNPR